MKALKRVLQLGIIIITLFSIFMVNGLVEDINVRSQIKEFKSRGEYVGTIKNIKYYAVKAKDGEDVSKRVVDNMDDWNIGYKGDILVTSRNPLSGNPITKWISKKTWIGHSGIVYDEFGKETIEIAGTLSPENNVVRIYQNTWADNYPQTPQIALLRVKGITEEQRAKTIEYAEDKIGTPYNYSFLFNRTNSFYCSDFVSRAIAYAGINVNYDFLATTGSDMIASPNTYLVYYKEAIDTIDTITYEVYFLVE